MFSPSHYFRQFRFQMNVVSSAWHFCIQFDPRLHRWVHLSSNLISFDHHWIFDIPKVYFSDLARCISHLIITGICSLLTSHELMTRQVPLIWKDEEKDFVNVGMDCWGRRNVEHKQFRDIGFWGFWGWYLRFWFLRFLRAFKLFLRRHLDLQVYFLILTPAHKRLASSLLWGFLKN